MKTYTIKNTGETMVISKNKEFLAEYRLTRGEEIKEIAQTRRAIDKHLENNGTLGNYQW